MPKRTTRRGGTQPTNSRNNFPMSDIPHWMRPFGALRYQECLLIIVSNSTVDRYTENSSGLYTQFLEKHVAPCCQPVGFLSHKSLLQPPSIALEMDRYLSSSPILRGPCSSIHCCCCQPQISSLLNLIRICNAQSISYRAYFRSPIYLR